VRVTDDVGTTASRTYSVEVITGMSISTTSVPKGKVGKKYSASLKAKGGKAPMTWSVVTAPLPEGLVLSAGSGKITGTPRAAGTFQVQLQVTDAANYSRVQSYSFVIRP
jgi:hypothetical protein